MWYMCVNMHACMHTLQVHMSAYFLVKRSRCHLGAVTSSFNLGIKHKQRWPFSPAVFLGGLLKQQCGLERSKRMELRSSASVAVSVSVSRGRFEVGAWTCIIGVDLEDRWKLARW